MMSILWYLYNTLRNNGLDSNDVIDNVSESVITMEPDWHVMCLLEDRTIPPIRTIMLQHLGLAILVFASPRYPGREALSPGAGGEPTRPSVSILSQPVRGAGYWSPQVLRVEGALNSNLYRSFQSVLPDTILNARERAYMAWEIADIFRWEADFSRDITSGDRFRLVFERLLSPYGEVRYGRLLAADIVLHGHSLTAFEFDDPQGRTAFYDAEGHSLHREFLRVPVEFKRISSEFGNRYHPILKRWRGHEGIDYAAQSGSPVMTIGDGIVVRAGLAGGYGKLVEIQHGNGLVTRYAHLRGFGSSIRVGAHVTQGQVIGFVGKTGLATGPHLHFEFRINGVARDPNEITMGYGTPVAPAYQATYLSVVSQYRRLLAPEGQTIAQRGE
jgi:murein DD-endopeptidase MepM/ murein hydrolase activator NlpD